MNFIGSCPGVREFYMAKVPQSPTGFHCSLFGSTLQQNGIEQGVTLHILCLEEDDEVLVEHFTSLPCQQLLIFLFSWPTRMNAS